MLQGNADSAIRSYDNEPKAVPVKPPTLIQEFLSSLHSKLDDYEKEVTDSARSNAKIKDRLYAALPISSPTSNKKEANTGVGKESAGDMKSNFLQLLDRFQYLNTISRIRNEELNDIHDHLANIL